MRDCLYLPDIEPRPKAVVKAESYRDYVGLSRHPDLGRQLLHLVKCIQNGAPLPCGCYRRGHDCTPDALLETTGIMHVHPGGSDSNVLLYLIQYPDWVLLLEVNGHRHFGRVPPGHLLTAMHQQCRVRLEAEWTQSRDQRAARLAASLAKLRPSRT